MQTLVFAQVCLITSLATRGIEGTFFKLVAMRFSIVKRAIFSVELLIFFIHS